MPAEKLWVTVYENDDDAAGIWLNDIGVPESRFRRIGAKDNFWAMGDTGPCGPCSEIFYDHGPNVFGGPPGTKDEGGDRFVEIWNLVQSGNEKAARDVFNRMVLPVNRIAAQGAGLFYHVHKEILRQRGISRTAKVRGPAPSMDELTRRDLQRVIDQCYRKSH